MKVKLLNLFSKERLQLLLTTLDQFKLWGWFFFFNLIVLYVFHIFLFINILLFNNLRKFQMHLLQRKYFIYRTTSTLLCEDWLKSSDQVKGQLK